MQLLKPTNNYCKSCSSFNVLEDTHGMIFCTDCFKSTAKHGISPGILEGNQQNIEEGKLQ